MRFISTSYLREPNIKLVKSVINNFTLRGESGPHSTHGHLLCHILNHCVRNGISFKLQYAAGIGYYVKRTALPTNEGATHANGA